MLTDDDVGRIQALKAKGYSKAKVAKAMGLARGTVAKYWGARGERVSLADLKRRFDECFVWRTCSDPACRLMHWAPPVLAGIRLSRMSEDLRLEGIAFQGEGQGLTALADR